MQLKKGPVSTELRHHFFHRMSHQYLESTWTKDVLKQEPLKEGYRNYTIIVLLFALIWLTNETFADVLTGMY